MRPLLLAMVGLPLTRSCWDPAIPLTLIRFTDNLPSSQPLSTCSTFLALTCSSSQFLSSRQGHHLCSYLLSPTSHMPYFLLALSVDLLLGPTYYLFYLLLFLLFSWSYLLLFSILSMAPPVPHFTHPTSFCSYLLQS